MKKYFRYKLIIIILTISLGNEIYYLCFKDQIIDSLKNNINSNYGILLKYSTIEYKLSAYVKNPNIKDLNIKINNLKDIKNNNDNIITNLQTNINDLKKQENTLETELQVLIKNKQKQNITSGNVLINNVITYYQYPNFPTGCEVVSLYILLKYYNVDVTINDIINNIQKGNLPYWENGNMYGPNPELEFVGNPLNEGGFGVYNDPIAKVAESYRKGVISKKDYPFDEVLKQVSLGNPVIVWNTMGMTIPFISESWTYKPTNETVNWISGEHALVVIGYNPSQVIVSDPYTGTIRYFDRKIFEDRYNYLGRRAVYYEI